MIELLMVVAIIAVLAAIGVPNFLEAQIRAKISRTRGDMAVVEAAIRAYHADHNAYPPNSPALRDLLTTFTGIGTVTPASLGLQPEAGSYRPYETYGPYGSYQFPRSEAVDFSGNALAVLTTPIAYFDGQLHRDVFSFQRTYEEKANLPFLYFNFSEQRASDDGTRWLLASPGPDHNVNFRNPAKGPWITYDPTNGTVSSGDLFLYGGKAPEPGPYGPMLPGALPPLPVSPEDPATSETVQTPNPFGGPMGMPGMGPGMI
jgi:type II secretory pathway pseudopilin PulG